MTPWQKIMRAYNDPNGLRGLKLSEKDVRFLGSHEIIRAVARNDNIEACRRQKRHKLVNGCCVRCGL